MKLQRKLFFNPGRPGREITFDNGALLSMTTIVLLSFPYHAEFSGFFPKTAFSIPSGTFAERS